VASFTTSLLATRAVADWTAPLLATRARRTMSERPERARVELVTRFGTGASALRPFDGAARPERGRRRGAAGSSLGELLLSEGLLSEEQLAEALSEQKQTSPKEPLGEILLRRGLVAGSSLVRLLARQCELKLEVEGGFGSGLRRAIELRHEAERTPAAAPFSTPTAAKSGLSSLALAAAAGQAADDQAPVVSAGGRRLGELLVQRRLLSGVELEQALCDQEDSGRLLGEILVERGFVSAVTLMNVLGEQADGDLDHEGGFGSGLRDAVETHFLRQRQRAG
jgi:hypothetical protein